MSVVELDSIVAFLGESFPSALRFAQIEELDPVLVRVPFREQHLRPGGTLGGPAMMTAADLATYVWVLSHYGLKPAFTTSLHMDFLRRPAPGDLVARVEGLKRGKRLAVARVSVFEDHGDEPVAHANVTYSVSS